MKARHSEPDGREELRKHYDRWHDRLAELERDHSFDPKSPPIWYGMVLPRLGDLSGLRVAEIGCGRGDFSLFLADQGGRVTGLDLSPTAIEVARAKALRRGIEVEFVEGDAQDTKLPDSRFDLVISCECLEHVPSPERMAQELYRITAPGGRCLLTTPSYLNGSLLAWLHSWLTRVPYDSGAGVQPRENFFLYFRTARLLRRCGFRTLDMESRLFRFLLLPGVDPARLQVREFRSSILNRALRPFGLHFLFVLERPPGSA